VIVRVIVRERDTKSAKTNEKQNSNSIGDKSTYRKLALFLRVGGERKAHTYVKTCYRSFTGSMNRKAARGGSGMRFAVGSGPQLPANHSQ
jgi:hypothetical protein